MLNKQSEYSSCSPAAEVAQFFNFHMRISFRESFTKDYNDSAETTRGLLANGGICKLLFQILRNMHATASNKTAYPRACFLSTSVFSENQIVIYGGRLRERSLYPL